MQGIAVAKDLPGDAPRQFTAEALTDRYGLAVGHWRGLRLDRRVFHLSDGGLQQVEIGVDFGLNCINWLMNREQGTGVGIPPKEKKLTALTLNESQLSKLGYTAVLGLPAIVAFFGIISWFQRRR